MSHIEGEINPDSDPLPRLNPPKPDIADAAIMDLIAKAPSWHKPTYLKMVGSSHLQVEYLQTIFDKQIERGNLTSEHADKITAAIRSEETNLLLIDSFMGAVVFGLLEKPLVPLIISTVASAGYPEWSIIAGLAFMSANPTATPYYGVRSIQEFIYKRKKLIEEKATKSETLQVLSQTTVEVTTATLLNLGPFPISIIANYAAPLLTKQRYGNLSGVIIRHHYDNMLDNLNRLKNTFHSKIQSKNRGLNLPSPTQLD